MEIHWVLGSVPSAAKGAILSPPLQQVEYFVHTLQVAMYGVDSMRQLAMKFLERDELANFSFQNDFLKPFVVVMRQSKALEIRELIIRCAGVLPSAVCQACGAQTLLCAVRSRPKRMAVALNSTLVSYPCS
jgi:Domain of unknown function (DUF1981)